jgi:hypothetical protein
MTRNDNSLARKAQRECCFRAMIDLSTIYICGSILSTGLIMNRSRTIISTLLITLFIASCETIPSEPPAAHPSAAPSASTPAAPSASTPNAPSGLRSIVLGDQTFSEEQFGKFVSWRCGDFHDYNRLGDTLVEVGSFANSEIKGMGFVLYDNSYSGVPALYQRKGLNLRWSWGESGSSYSFVIKPDGTGLYYDFSNTEEGELISANEVYKCIHS